VEADVLLTRHTAPVEGYDASTYGERFADVYDDWYGDLTEVDACTGRLAVLADGGPVLELGVGSGRLALPLAARGVEVHGIDASEAMLARLRAKPGSDAIRVTQGDMADLDLGEPPPFTVVFAAFNTLFNLPTAEAQRRCFERVASLLAPQGVFVVEAFVPAERGTAGPAGSVSPRRITADEVVLSVSHHDAPQQTISGQHVHITDRGIRLRPWHLRYAPPEELDAMAAEAGLTLTWRCADWAETPFGPDAGVHVSAYHRGNVRSVLPPGSA
jgi:SAM-dependent methyltransferase